MFPRFRRSFRRLSPARRLLVMEAAVCLIAAKILIHTVPFRRLAATIRATKANPPGGGETAPVLAEIAWACRAIGRRVSPLGQCLLQAVAAHWMARRRQVGSTLYLGTRIDNGRLSAHAWLCAGEHFVVGGENHAGFATIAALGEQ